jgi:hypothetical protein
MKASGKRPPVMLTQFYHGVPILNTLQEEGLRLLVLIPHRDTRNLFRRWSEGLFAAGLSGAWAFPWAVPLACLSRPLLPAELREAAFAVRESLGRGDGKMRTTAAALCPLPDFSSRPPETGPAGRGGRKGPALYGPRLEPEGLGEALQGAGAAAFLHRFSPLVLGSALFEESGELSGLRAALPPPPETAFRAAALANMVYRRRAGKGASLFEWKTGKARWLPSRGQIPRFVKQGDV